MLGRVKFSEDLVEDLVLKALPYRRYGRYIFRTEGRSEQKINSLLKYTEKGFYDK
jgi:hypothetical protein